MMRWLKRRTTAISCCAVLVTVTSLFALYLNPIHNYHPVPPFFSLDCPHNIAIILCQDNSSGIANSFGRQLNQSVVLLKSLSIHASPCFNIFVIASSHSVYELLVRRVTSLWGQRWVHTLRMSFVPVTYPKGVDADMTLWFRPCATARLFIPDLLLNLDSVLYVDTDFIFLHNPGLLLEHAENMRFGSTKIAAMAPCLFHYGSPTNQVPFYGDSGLNAGLMIMNLKRMRETGWVNKVRLVADMYASKIKLADQDILNIFFHYFPEELLELSCDWNFRPFQCRPNSHCDSSLLNGISALHGNALSFTPSGPEPLFATTFTAFSQLGLTNDFQLGPFLDELENRLLATEERFPSSHCAKYGDFSALVLHKLHQSINQ